MLVRVSVFNLSKRDTVQGHMQLQCGKTQRSKASPHCWAAESPPETNENQRRRQELASEKPPTSATHNACSSTAINLDIALRSPPAPTEGALNFHALVPPSSKQENTATNDAFYATLGVLHSILSLPSVESHV
eukprot:834660-Amphidinium_carterae.1